MINSIIVVMWLTRLGSFLFNRILKDQVDTRFNEIKKSNLRFMGFWTIQVKIISNRQFGFS